MGIDAMIRQNSGSPRGMTVKQLGNILNNMPDDMVVVVEGGRLIEPHVITELLPPELDEGDLHSLASNTVMLTVGGVWKSTPLEE